MARRRHNKALARIKPQWNLSAALLLVSNLITIGLAISQKWNVVDLMVTYWAQSVTIGFFNWKRMRALEDLSPESSGTEGRRLPGLGKRFMSGFFALHYGIFHFVYMVFLIVGVVAFGLDSPWVILGIATFVVNHALSYRFTLADDRKREVSADSLFFFPYARILPMHLTIILGAFVAMSLSPSNPVVLVFFLILKTAADMIMHFVERSRGKDSSMVMEE